MPEPGRVKTRLLGPLTPAQAAAIHRACLADTVGHVARVPGCWKSLRVAAGPDEARELAAALELDRTWQVGVQRGRNLGARLEGAFRSFSRPGYGRVVVVGTDTPWMGTERILSALELLNTTDAVLGPTADGGYYLVGARRLVPAMFRNIPWGTSQVFERTVGALERAHASYRLLPRDFDLDRPEDLARAAALLRKDETRAPALAQVLKKLQGESVSRSSRRRAPARRRRTPPLGRA
jgi:rSAM/selenodomain-associated transferase 1